jgi:hypothetical protein
MNDAYNDALDRMEQNRALQWEYFEEEHEEEPFLLSPDQIQEFVRECEGLPEEDLDVLLTDDQRQWIYDHY